MDVVDVGLVASLVGDAEDDGGAGTVDVGGGAPPPLEQALSSTMPSTAAYERLGLDLDTAIGVPWDRPVTRAASAAARPKTLPP